MKICEFEARSFDPNRVAESVMAGDIGVVHGVFDQATTREAILATLRWADDVPAYDPQRGDPEPLPGESHHRVDMDPPKSNTPHVFHVHNLDNLECLPNTERIALTAVFDPMCRLWMDLTGITAEFSPQPGSLALHPQVIHYPKGGGYFGRHEHSLLPQKIGLITSLAGRGEHFKSGATVFYDGERELDVEPAQTIGSVTLFRYDIPHAVSKVDPDKELDFGQPTGRWVAVLPYR